MGENGCGINVHAWGVVSIKDEDKDENEDEIGVWEVGRSMFICVGIESVEVKGIATLGTEMEVCSCEWEFFFFKLRNLVFKDWIFRCSNPWLTKPIWICFHNSELARVWNCECKEIKKETSFGVQRFLCTIGLCFKKKHQ